MSTAYFTEVTKPEDIEALSTLPQPVHVLGGGSNILLSAPVLGTVVRNCLKGIAKAAENDTHIWLQVSAGEVWHELVMYVVANGWGGVENLALIPGTVGAAPIQNIGAYGVEVKDVLTEVTFYHLEDKVFVTLPAAACRFGYRDSIFKNELRGKVFITTVTLMLMKKPVFNTSYGAIEQELQAMGVQGLTVAAIAQAVINIRSSKLPDPKVTGNAGSFFKNPTITTAQYEQLVAEHEGMPQFPAGAGMVKVPAAWLIEQCGWKGYRRGDAGVHSRQALVLVNYGGASGGEVWQLSGDIVASVRERFGITLEREVQVW